MEKQLSYCKLPGITTDDHSYGCKTIPDGLKYLADIHGDKDAFIFVSKTNDRECISWKCLVEKSQSVAHKLIHLGIKKGDRIAIDLPNSPEWLFLTLGAMQAAAIPVAINTKNKDYDNIIQLLKKVANCSMVFIDSYTTDNHWKAFKIYLDVINADGSVESKHLPYLRYAFVRFGSNTEEAGCGNALDRFLNTITPDALTTLPELNENDIAFEKQSSGSSGPSKLVSRTHASVTKILSRQRMIHPSLMLKIREYNDNWFSWAGGFPTSLISGKTRILLKTDGLTRAERLSNALRICIQEKCNTLIPTKYLIEYLVASKDKLPQNWFVASIYISGFPMTANIAELLREPKVTRVLELMYGAAEIHDLASVKMTSESQFKEFYCGKLIQGIETEVRVVDDEENIVPVGCRGELQVRGKNVFKEYHNDPEKTTAAFTVDGWFKTDDIAMMTAEHDLYVYGRKSNIINCGGTKVDANILENELANYPGIKSVVVVPVPDPELFTCMCGFFRVEKDSRITVEEIFDFMKSLRKERMADFKNVPTHVIIVNEFPDTVSGKPKRYVLKQMALVHITSCCCEVFSKTLYQR